MKGKLITLVCVMLSFMTCLMGIGYAAVSGELYITGGAEYEYIHPVYITDVTRYNANNNNNTLDSKTYAGTFLNSNITLYRYRNYGQTNASGSYIVLAVTVKNATNRDYAYQGITGAEDIANLAIGVYQDANCTVELNSSNGIVSKKNATGEEQSLTFYVKMSHTQNSQKEYNPLLTFRFTTEITKEDQEAVGKTVAQKFLEILNTEADYNSLTSAMDENYNSTKGDWTVSYIGNVTGSSDDDTELLIELFEGTLSLNINGVNVDVTCIIKRENIDGNTSTGDDYTVGATTYEGCDMTLYMTTANFENLSFNDYPTVYAMVFTKVSEDVDWEQIGAEMYEGTAQVVGYVGGESTGSFDTGTWTSSAEYHGVGGGANIKTIIAACLAEDE